MNAMFSERRQFSLTRRLITNRKLKLMMLYNNNASISEKPLLTWLELLFNLQAMERVRFLSRFIINKIKGLFYSLQKGRKWR